MGLSGNLRTMDLPEILQWVSTGRKTGALHLDGRSVQKRIFFQEGVICSSWSNDPRESLGQFLVRERLLTEEQLFRSLLRQEREGRPLGAILVGDDTLGEDAIQRILRLKVEESIYDLFLWPEGRFEFKDGEVQGDGLIVIRMEVTAAILEGARRVDEWARIRDVFPSSAVAFRLPKGIPDEGLEPAERQLLELAATGRTLAALSLELRRSDFDTAEAALRLHARGLLEVDHVDADTAADPVGLTQELLAMGYRRLSERRYDKAMQAYEQVLAVDRLNQNAKKGLVAVVEARERERSARRVPLDRIPELAMAMSELTRLDIDPQEGFVLSRVNGQWDVQSILKLCPMSEEDVLLIFARLLERKVIAFR